MHILTDTKLIPYLIHLPRQTGTGEPGSSRAPTKVVYLERLCAMLIDGEAGEVRASTYTSYALIFGPS